MITITLERASSGFIQKFTISGHSDFAVEGPDMICTSISVLGQTAVGALQDLANLKVDFLIKETEGYMECTVPDPDEMASGQYQIANIIMDTFALGCRQVANSYGNKKKKYIHIKNSSFVE